MQFSVVLENIELCIAFQIPSFFCDFVVTEEEITLGIFNDPQSRDRCLCYYRDLVGIEDCLG